MLDKQAEIKNFEDFVVSSWYFQVLTKMKKSTLEDLTNDYLLLKMEEDFDRIFPVDNVKKN